MLPAHGVRVREGRRCGSRASSDRRVLPVAGGPDAPRPAFRTCQGKYDEQPGASWHLGGPQVRPGGLFRNCQDLAWGTARPRPAEAAGVTCRTPVQTRPTRAVSFPFSGPSSRLSVPRALSPGVPAPWKSDGTGTPLVTVRVPAGRAGPSVGRGVGGPRCGGVSPTRGLRGREGQAGSVETDSPEAGGAGQPGGQWRAGPTRARLGPGALPRLLRPHSLGSLLLLSLLPSRRRGWACPVTARGGYCPLGTG